MGDHHSQLVPTSETRRNWIAAMRFRWRLTSRSWKIFFFFFFLAFFASYFFLAPMMSQQKSVFGDATCQEDLQHINEIQNTNIEATSASQLAEILYKSVTRPVQGKVHGKHDNNSQMHLEKVLWTIHSCKKIFWNPKIALKLGRIKLDGWFHDIN